jgi:hypothetical protein
MRPCHYRAEPEMSLHEVLCTPLGTASRKHGLSREAGEEEVEEEVDKRRRAARDRTESDAGIGQEEEDRREERLRQMERGQQLRLLHRLILPLSSRRARQYREGRTRRTQGLLHPPTEDTSTRPT